MRMCTIKSLTNLILTMFILLPAIAVGTECESVPIDKKDWVTEAVITQKFQVDAIFIGKVTKAAQPQYGSSLCTVHIQPEEVFKGEPGQEVIADHYNRTNEKRCMIKENERYLFYVSNSAMGQKLKNWYFPFCRLDNYVPYDMAGKEIEIIRRILIKRTTKNS